MCDNQSLLFVLHDSRETNATHPFQYKDLHYVAIVNETMSLYKLTVNKIWKFKKMEQKIKKGSIFEMIYIKLNNKLGCARVKL